MENTQILKIVPVAGSELNSPILADKKVYDSPVYKQPNLQKTYEEIKKTNGTLFIPDNIPSSFKVVYSGLDNHVQGSHIYLRKNKTDIIHIAQLLTTAALQVKDGYHQTIEINNCSGFVIYGRWVGIKSRAKAGQPLPLEWYPDNAISIYLEKEGWLLIADYRFSSENAMDCESELKSIVESFTAY